MKIVGALLIIIASVASSYLYEKRQKTLLTDLKEIKRFILFVSIQIEHFSMSLKQVYSKYGILSKPIASLISGERISCWGKDTEDELFSCFSSLGSGYKSDELKRLNQLNLHLEQKILEFEKTYKDKIKVFRALALFVGICVVIIMI